MTGHPLAGMHPFACSYWPLDYSELCILVAFESDKNCKFQTKIKIRFNICKKISWNSENQSDFQNES